MTTILTGRIEAELTTEHPASSYGIPVLVIDGQGYGTADTIPSLDLSAGDLVRRFLSKTFAPPEGCEWAIVCRSTSTPARRFLGLPTGRPRKTPGGSEARMVTLPRALWERIDEAAQEGETFSGVIERCVTEVLD